MHEASANVFLALSRWAYRQEENYLTESLFVLLKNIFEDNQKVARRILAFLAGIPSVKRALDLSNPNLFLQYCTDVDGIPDGVIRTKDIFLLIEAKVSAFLSENQYQAYIRHLVNEEAKYKKFVLLTHDRIDHPKGNTDVRYIRWFELGVFFENILRANVLEEFNTRLIKDFLALLEDKGLAIIHVSSTLAQAVNYLKFERSKADKSGARVRDLEMLRKDSQLIPLYALLTMMGEAVKRSTYSKIFKFDSGRHSGGWIGYNLNSMEYFFSVDIKTGDRIYLEAYDRKRKLNENGELFMKRTYGEDDYLGWWIEKKIDNSFFAESEVEQLSDICDFFDEAIKESNKYTDIKK